MKKIKSIKFYSMKLKMIKQFFKKQLIEIVFNHHQNREKKICLKHNHQFEYIDMIKINNAIKFIIANEIFKKYVFCDVNQNLQNVK